VSTAIRRLLSAIFRATPEIAFLASSLASVSVLNCPLEPRLVRHPRSEPLAGVIKVQHTVLEGDRRLARNA
jgi:hypothetical protein